MAARAAQQSHETIAKPKPARVESSASAAPQAQMHTQAQASLTPGGAMNGTLGARQTQRVVLQMQRQYGNRSVARALTQNRDAVPPNVAIVQRKAAASPAIVPARDPKFSAVTSKLRQIADKEKQHRPADARASQTQAAAVAPPNDVASQAKAAQVGKMNDQKPGDFDKAAFVAAVRAAIEAATPKNIDEAEKYKASGKAGQAKEQVSGLVGKNKEAAAQAIKGATNEAPDASKAKPKPVTPAVAEPAGSPPASVDAAAAMPAPTPAAELDLSQDQRTTDPRMKDAHVTDTQLANSNEPQFKDALAAKHSADASTVNAPKAFKADEQKVLGNAKAQSNSAAATGIAGMHAGRTAALGKAAGHQAAGKAADEAKRAKVAADLEGIYAHTKQDVTSILDGIEGKIDPIFNAGEAAARDEMQTKIEVDTKKFHDERGLIDSLLDVFSSPPELNAIIDRAVKQFMSRMDGVIDRIADIVGAELKRAKMRIASGQKEIAQHIASLPRDLKQIGQGLLAGFNDKFKELTSQVDERRDALVDTLAQKYSAARDAVNERANAMKDANKGLWDKAKEAIGGTIETILKLKDMLLGVLSRASAVIDKIIADPIAFLNNLLAAVKQGLHQFVGNIFTHLKSGLMGWLFGTLAEAGIELPATFDLKGILQLVLSLLGVTYQNIRQRAVGLLGEKTVSAMEKAVDIFKTLATEGVAGIWKFIVDKLSSLKDTMLGQIQDFVVTKVITAGVTWLVSLFNPASAFVKACKMIYDVVMFFVERGSQIMGLVNSIVDGAGAIASGAIGGAANLVEQSLAKALPVAISFLASLLGLGGIADKIKEIVKKIQEPVNKAIDAVVNGAVSLFKKIGGDKVIDAVKKGVSWGKDKIEKGKKWVKDKAQNAKKWAKDKFYGGTQEDKEKRLEKGMAAGVKAINDEKGDEVPERIAKTKLAVLRVRYRLPVLEAIVQGGRWAVHGEIQRATLTSDKSAASQRRNIGWPEFATRSQKNRLRAALEVARKLEGDSNLDMVSLNRYLATAKDQQELEMIIRRIERDVQDRLELRHDLSHTEARTGRIEGTDAEGTTTKTRISAHSHERVLGAGMEGEGGAIPLDHARHHIAPKSGGGKVGARIRQLLRQAGVSVDDPANGVSLAGFAKDPRATYESSSAHSRVHTFALPGSNLQLLLSDLQTVRGDADGIRAVLRHHGQALYDGRHIDSQEFRLGPDYEPPKPLKKGEKRDLDVDPDED